MWGFPGGREEAESLGVLDGWKALDSWRKSGHLAHCLHGLGTLDVWGQGAILCLKGET